MLKNAARAEVIPWGNFLQNFSLQVFLQKLLASVLPSPESLKVSSEGVWKPASCKKISPIRLCRLRIIIFIAFLPAVLAGCSELSTSLPKRTAQEQLLISTAADRAMARMDLRSVNGKRVFVDDTHLVAYDAAYVIGKFRNAISFNKGKIVDSRAQADIIVELYSGALSVNESSFNLGVPAIELSLLGTGFATPELSVFKILTQRSIAKFSAFGYDSIDRELIFSTGTQFGSTTARSYTVLLAGPFTFADMPPPPPEDTEDTFSLVVTPRIEEEIDQQEIEEE